jgi:hypothetical protein
MSSLTLPVLLLMTLAGAALLFYWPVLIGAPFGKAWFWEDFTEQNYPYRFYQATYMREGIFPLWNPYIFGGLPFAADIQSGAFYPPNWIAALFVGGGLLAPEAAEAIQIAHVVIGGILAGLLARSLFGGRAGPLFAAVAFAFSSFMVVRMKHGNIAETAAWIPGILLLLRHAILDRSVAAAALGAVLFALSFLAGAPQYALFAGMAAALFALHEILSAPRGERSPIAAAPPLALFVALTLLLSAVALLPSLELSRETLRASLSYDAASEVSFHPKFLVTFLLPKFYGTTAGGFTSRFFGGTYYEFWELASYVGIPTLILAVLGLMRPIDRAARSIILVGGFGFLLALGKLGPLHPLLFHLLGPYQRFRVPGRAIFLVSLALVLLAARGIARWESGALAGRESRRLAWVSVIVAALIVAATIVGIALGPAAATPARVRDALLALALVGATHFALARGRRAGAPSRAGWLLAAIVACDLALSGFTYNLGPNHPASVVFSKTNVVDYIRKNLAGEPYRVTIRRPEGMLLMRNAGSLLRVATLDGYNQLRLRRSHELMSLADPKPDAAHSSADLSRIHTLWSVLYRTQPSAERGVLTLVKNPEALPRARLVHEARVFESDAALLEAITSADWRPASTVALESGSAGASAASGSWPAPSDESPARVTRFTPDRIDVEIDARAPGYLVLTDPFYPGWEARVDGAPAEIVRADYALRAVRVEAGARRVEFRFRPRSVMTGAALTGAGLIAVALIVLLRRSGTRALLAQVLAR